MNVFFIPSWYPSETDPLPGIFFRQQAQALTALEKDVRIGVSIWGQNDERLLLWAGQPVGSFIKLIKPMPAPSVKKSNEGRLIELFRPARTWSRKLLEGNLKTIINVNDRNFHEFEAIFGKVDLIHAHVAFPGGYIAKKLSEIHGVPYVITEHMSPFPHEHFLVSGILDNRLQEAYGSAARNIAVSKGLESGMKRFGVRNIVVIPNMTDFKFFTPEEPGGAIDRPFTFFFLGRLTHQKGVDILLKAFAKLKGEALLRIGGDGPLKDDLKALARKLGIDKKVSWTGRLDHEAARMEYRRCDAFVLPSRHESMGVVVVEAMACGKPVIATYCGGPEEFVDHHSGYVVHPDNVEKLAEAMGKMRKNHATFKGWYFREEARKRFSHEAVAGQIMALYKEVLEEDSSN